MPTFITLSNFTDQGIKNIKDSLKRVEWVKEQCKKHGVTMKSVHWTMGPYDAIGVFEAPDGPTMSAFSLAISMAGNLRGQTLPAYGLEEWTGIVKKI